MKNGNSQLFTRIAILVGGAAAFFSLGQLVSVWWMVITGAASLAIWMIIWLWPESVPAKVRK